MAKILEHGSIKFSENSFQLLDWKIATEGHKPDDVNYWESRLIRQLALNMLKVAHLLDTTAPLPAPVWFNFDEADRMNRHPDYWQTIAAPHD